MDLTTILQLIMITFFMALIIMNLCHTLYPDAMEGFVTKDMIESKKEELERNPSKHGTTDGDSGNYSYLESKLTSVAGKLDSINERLARLEESGEETVTTVEENKLMIDEIMKQTQEDAVNIGGIIDEEE